MLVRTQGRNNDVGCSSLNRVAEHADSVEYHHHQETDVNKGLDVSNGTMTTVVGPNNDGLYIETSIYAAPGTSVAIIQRSKSRQIALERRTAAKTGHISRLAKSSSYEKPNDHAAKHDSSSLEKEELDGSILVQPTVLQAGHFNVPDVSLGSNTTRKASLTSKTEGQNNPISSGRITRSRRSSRQQSGGHGSTDEVDFSLGSGYASKTSVTEKTQDTQRQNRPIISGRITRSRSLSQQKVEEDAVPRFVDASVETSQRLSDKIAAPRATQSRSGSPKESARQGASHSKEDHASSLKMQIKEGDLGDRGEESDGAYTRCLNDENENPVADELSSSFNVAVIVL